MSKFVGIGIVLLFASCTGPPFYRAPEYPPIPQIQAGDTPEHVREILGKPDDWKNGWWIDGGVRYEACDQVWYYAGKGRVIFDGFDARVVQSQFDPRQPKFAVDQPYSGLY